MLVFKLNLMNRKNFFYKILKKNKVNLLIKKYKLVLFKIMMMNLFKIMKTKIKKMIKLKAILLLIKVIQIKLDNKDIDIVFFK